MGIFGVFLEFTKEAFGDGDGGGGRGHCLFVLKVGRKKQVLFLFVVVVVVELIVVERTLLDYLETSSGARTDTAIVQVREWCRYKCRLVYVRSFRCVACRSIVQ